MSITPPTQQLYRVTMTAYKTFYVEATSQEAALHHPKVEDESSPFANDFDWEHEETEARALSAEEATMVYKRRANEIVPADEDDAGDDTTDSGDGTEVDA